MLDEAPGYRGQTGSSRARLKGSGDKALFGVTEHNFDLLARHPGEPLQKFVDSSAAFDILEQGPHRDTAVFE